MIETRTLPPSSTMSSWLSSHDANILSTNPATVLSLDLLPGTKRRHGTCIMDCTYCYGCRGHQAYRTAVSLQDRRAAEYIRDPVGFAHRVIDALRRFNEHFELDIGKPWRPLRLFGNGDGYTIRHLDAFLETLTRGWVEFYGYSRILVDDARIMFSVDRDTHPDVLLAAIEMGKRIAYVRQSADDIPPDCAQVIFPQHTKREHIPTDRRDCFKLRHSHGPGVCFSCRRCY